MTTAARTSNPTPSPEAPNSPEAPKPAVPSRLAGYWQALLARVRARPWAFATSALCATFASYIIAYPLLVVKYPPMTDLPFHAAGMSILRHYLDPAFHFREQFELHFLKTPYWTLHGLGALFALVLPITWAAKLATAVMLAMVPAGLAVLFRGMKKSAALGAALGLPLVWNKLTHWGFLNFMGAVGLFALVVGLTLLVLDRPTRKRRWALALALVGVFGTHIFRFPFAIGAVPGIALVLYPATRRFRPILAPMVPSLLLFAAWLVVRPRELSTDQMEPLQLHTERINEIGGLLFGSFVGAKEQELARRTGQVLGAVAAVCLVANAVERRWALGTPRRWVFSLCAHVAVLGIALVCFVLFLTLPMQIGAGWWYVYPREIVSTLVIAAALFPDAPRNVAARLAVVGAIALASASQALYVAEEYARFDTATEDFDRIVAAVPPAPRLGYMVFDHGGSTRADTPYIHLPAWVQAEKGGWLSFHFVGWKVWPIWYREGSAAVPPPTPTRFEWMPEAFDLTTRGKFFDWFLVRSSYSPEARFRVDPELRLVKHVGTWWLFHREPSPPAP